MEYRRLGEGDLEISPVILGTWALGGWLWGGTAKNDAEQAVNASIDAGINCLDTAPVYGFGLSEELVGQAVKGRRDKIIVATKCGLVWDDRPGSTKFFDTVNNQGQPIEVQVCLRKESIIRECDDSLRRLGVDEIDLYQCHWPDPNTPIEDTVEGLLSLRDSGKIREFGVSNFSVEQLEECMKYAKPSSNQPKYSLLSRDVEKDVLPFCHEHEIGVIAYSPMEMGLLTGKIGMDYEFGEGDIRNNRPWFKPDKRQEVLDALELIRPIAERYDATLAQISVAWLFSQPGVTAAIVGARNGDQASANVQAANLALDPEDIAEIRRVFEPLTLGADYDPRTAKR